MIPWLAYSHLNSYLELAKRLTKRNYQIYLCSSPINLTSINNRLTDEHSPSITLVEFHLQPSPELPPHYHTTNGLPTHLLQTLRISEESAGPEFLGGILKTLTPDLVIYDFNSSWAPTVASSYNIPAVQFMITGTASFCLFIHHSQRPGMEFPFPGTQLQGYHARRLRERLQAPKTDGRLKEAMQKSKRIILFNSFRGLEGKYIDYLSDLLEKKIVPVGPIVQEVAADDKEEDGEIMRWLEEKEESSTVFVSFGTECFLTKPEMEEMAHGLELSKVNFIWVVRSPQGGEMKKTRVKEAMPDGFLERLRVGEIGLVVEGWAPQAKILKHPNIGGFVSHCGWNSTMESLRFGVPVIAVPMLHDQPVNARLVEEVGVGVEVKRGEDGRLDREDIAQVIRKVVADKNGGEIRTRARELRKTIELEGEKQIDGLVQELNQLLID